jgi:hypothetical protein
VTQARSVASRPGQSRASRCPGPSAAETARGDFPGRRIPTGQMPAQEGPAGPRPVPRHGPRLLLRTGPAP